LGCGKERESPREREGNEKATTAMKIRLRELLDILQCLFSHHFGEGVEDRGTAGVRIDNDFPPTEFLRNLTV
jgi:hypothetical protein